MEETLNYACGLGEGTCLSQERSTAPTYKVGQVRGYGKGNLWNLWFYLESMQSKRLFLAW
jgi:hypothetical protein